MNLSCVEKKYLDVQGLQMYRIRLHGCHLKENHICGIICISCSERALYLSIQGSTKQAVDSK